MKFLDRTARKVGGKCLAMQLPKMDGYKAKLQVAMDTSQHLSSKSVETLVAEADLILRSWWVSSMAPGSHDAEWFDRIEATKSNQLAHESFDEDEEDD